MAQQAITGRDQIQAGTIRRSRIDITTSSQALITKIVAGSNIAITSTGVDAGTGDVTIRAVPSMARVFLLMGA